MTACPFCVRISRAEFDGGGELAVHFPDAYPLNPGYTLVVPRRHVDDYNALMERGQAAMWRLVSEVCRRLDHDGRPAGYNIGINVGAAGGQTVAHAHLHVIPRFPGDVDDPRGGIRWVIPGCAKYWT